MLGGGATPGCDVAHGRVTHQRIDIDLSIVLRLFNIVFVLPLSSLLLLLLITDGVAGEQQKQSCARVRIFLKHE